jgi:hypothetical protein
MKNNPQTDILKQIQTDILKQIVEDWRNYLIGVGSSYPPDKEEYELFFDRMVTNIEEAEEILL